MLIAIIVLFALYFTDKQKEKTKPNILPDKAKSKKVVKRNTSPQTNGTDSTNPEGFECPHRFGFLRTRKNKAIPEECVGCEKRVGCMLSQD